MQEVTLNSRIKFPKGTQKHFLKDAGIALHMKTSELAKIACVHERTLRDWKREKYKMPFASLFSLCYKLNTRFPKNIELLPAYWSVKEASKLGAKRYRELYGNPGTPEGRRQGGLTTQRRFREHPELAKKFGFVVRKEIKYPDKSIELAEFIGIMLGDGALRSKYQITVSFDYKRDSEYAKYICGLIKRLFLIDCNIYRRKQDNGADIVATSANLVDFLIKQGLKRGNKVKNQIGIPRWIYEKPDYQRACLRGLIDTDGGLYLHRYNSYSKTYIYLKLCFSNNSKPLLYFVLHTLNGMNCKAHLNENKVSIYSMSGVKRYCSEIGFHNPRKIKKFQEHKL